MRDVMLILKILTAIAIGWGVAWWIVDLLVKRSMRRDFNQTDTDNSRDKPLGVQDLDKLYRRINTLHTDLQRLNRRLREIEQFMMALEIDLKNLGNNKR